MRPGREPAHEAGFFSPSKEIMKKTILAVAMLAILAGCGEKEASFNTVEDARAQARANAEWNATKYRSESPRLQGLKIVGHGDPTQTAQCPQGSGWAQLSIMNVDKEAQTVEKYVVMCSTVSEPWAATCARDFEKTLHAKEENTCNKSIPASPFPKIGK
jgi:hypothetical protein